MTDEERYAQAISEAANALRLAAMSRPRKASALATVADRWMRLAGLVSGRWQI